MSEKGSLEDVQAQPSPAEEQGQQSTEEIQAEADHKATEMEEAEGEAEASLGEDEGVAEKPSAAEAGEEKESAAATGDDKEEAIEQQQPAAAATTEEEEGGGASVKKEDPEIVPAPDETRKPSEEGATKDEPSEEPAAKSKKRGGFLGRRRKEPKEAKPAAAATASGKKGVELNIILLDQVRTCDTFERKVKIEDIIKAAHTEAAVEEVDYFSLFYFDDHDRISQKVFIDPNKSLKDVLPKDKQKEVELKHGVKYYVPDPIKQLKDDHSRYLYCLQLCQDIRDGWVLVDRETATRLTALMLQSTLENYTPEEHLPGYTAALEDFMLLPKSTRPADYEEQLVVLHKSKFGYTRDQAESEFLETAKTLRRYGEHLFSVMDEERSTHLLLGNSCRGISVYDNETEQAHYNWQDIVKISYKKKRFRIRFRAPGADESAAVETRSFFTGPAPQAKKVWRNAVEQHTFFRLSEPERPTAFQTLFRRNTLNFHGNTLRQSQRVKRERTDHKFARTYSENYAKRRGQNQKFVVGKQAPPSEEKTWLLLDQPPRGRGHVDAGKSELQKVQVDFRLSDGLPDDHHHYLIHRDHTGSFEVLGSAAMEEEGERAYKLSLIDEDSQQATMTVSLNIDPDSTDLGEIGDITSPLFDSQRLPVARMGDAVVTTTTVTEFEGKPLTSGLHTQQYTNGTRHGGESTNGIAAEDLRVGPAYDGTEEANQVHLFLDQEHGLMREVFQEQGNGVPENGIMENGDHLELDGHRGLPVEVEVVVS